MSELTGTGGFADAVRALTVGADNRAVVDLPDRVGLAAEALGAGPAEIWLADYQQRSLVPLSGGEVVDIASSIAGRAFLSAEAVEVERDDHFVLWLPLVDGVDRIGVLELEFPSQVPLASAPDLACFASIVATKVVSGALRTDMFARLRRRRDMALAAELQWQMLPPLSSSTGFVTVAGMLEPAYDVGGDLFDYAHNGRFTHFALFDAVGHGLESSLVSTLAVGTYRHSRRRNDGLLATADLLDHTIHDRFPDSQFVTGLLFILDADTGQLNWLNAGHPPPMLLRGGKVVAELETPPRPPLGLGHLMPEPPTPGLHQLEPGDRVLLYTDGVTEARTPSGDDFGVERLAELLERADASGYSAIEVVRRLSHAVLDHHGGRLADDATTLLVAWHP
ncbi:MAG: serine/threonine-protein phosphatase [Actinomycetota bacterium]|nr:serine/threonine-protein phosphatase [Acidimicrobiia bacterium]MDQ3294259.1 serine/threonine-protein phosphatase [Actinomycetota bacterium]